MSGRVHISRPRDGVALFEIDNPSTNALGSAIRAQFEDELDRLEQDFSIRAVVLTGRGDAFCSGDDLREVLTRGEDAADSLGRFGRLLDKIEAFRVPVIAAVNGHAIGGGLELALCCDIRIASPNAWFLAAGVNVGLMASVYRLPRLIGAGRASIMLFTGTKIDATRACEWGLVSDIHPREKLVDTTLDLAARIASRAPLSVEASKRMVRQSFDLTDETWRAASGRELSALVKSSDHKAAVQAFLERREPVFTRS